MSILDNKLSNDDKDKIKQVHGAFSYLKDFVKANRELILRWKQRLKHINYVYFNQTS